MSPQLSRRAPVHLLALLVLLLLPLVQAATVSDQASAQSTSDRVRSDALKQGTDGGSGVMGFVWAGFCLLLGAPLLGGGLKLMRFTCAAGLGLPVCFLMWISFINSSPTNGFAKTPMLNDIVISIPILLVTALALALGMFRPARWVGHLLLCSCGGIALILQVMLFKEGLLIPVLPVIWGLMGLMIVLGVLAGLWWQRMAVASCSSLVGAFLLSLAVDLILNRDQAMSFGLRVIFDDNDAHSTLLVRKNYKPTIKSVIILASGLGLALFATIFQLLVYKGDFIARPLSKAWSSLLEPPSEKSPFDFNRRTTKTFAEDLDPALLATPGEPYRRPWERTSLDTPTPAAGPGIASSESYFPSVNAEEEERKRYEQEQLKMYEEQQRYARERQAWEAQELAGRVGMVVAPRGEVRGGQQGQGTPALTPSDFFDPRTTLMRPPTAFRPPQKTTNPNPTPSVPRSSNRSPAPFSQFPPAPDRPARGGQPPQSQHQQTVPWAPLIRKLSRKASQPRSKSRVAELQTPDRSMADSPSSVYSQQTAYPSEGNEGRAGLLRALENDKGRKRESPMPQPQYDYGAGKGKGTGKDRPLKSGEQKEGARRYSPPSRMY